MSGPIRVLVAEDSPTARALLAAMLESAPDITVIGEARDGVEAVEMAEHLRPDLITMDVHMPRLDGLAATRRIMARAPTPILIVTGVDPHDVELSLEATTAGALMVVAKPSAPASPGHTMQRAWLIDMVRAMSQVKVVRRWDRPPTPAWSRAQSEPSPATERRSPIAQRPAPRVVAMAASTGGPAAVRRVLDTLPANFAAPVLIVQHIASGFSEGFAAWLGHSCAIDVKIAEDGEPLRPGTAYVAPDDRHLCVRQGGAVAVSQSAANGGFRPSADNLFHSVARASGARAAAVILTGMGRDGVDGLSAVRASGGFTIAQDERTSIVYGMPKEAVTAGAVETILPIEDIGPELKRLILGGS